MAYDVRCLRKKMASSFPERPGKTSSSFSSIIQTRTVMFKQALFYEGVNDVHKYLRNIRQNKSS